MNKLSMLQLLIFTFVVLTIKVDADLTDTFDKRASLSYFKRQNELSDSSSNSPSTLSSLSKRATLSYFKRGHHGHGLNELQHIRQILEICPCLNKDYLQWLEENLLLRKDTSSNNNDNDEILNSGKRASLAYFK
ncbi:hypothetical protein EWB00_008802 [Schistosoma japonicum]|uniref:Uncharacterized protein n=1 Tax=Schistosoma japonicum TaxID=6182 RepID=C1LGQ6_SCHJA|nr:hypothetical protein KSF78_0000143 [Schistosoma japonicum]TNN05885.1 hypothetical protein EWB00_008802 [Schistosoma japonicum]CAX73884.1 hypothetical protein [Schistosoma japonicum]